jgi:hypothetical protein
LRKGAYLLAGFNSWRLFNDWFVQCTIFFPANVLVYEKNLMFNLLACLFLASASPPRAAHHRHPECGVVHGE